MRRLFQAVTLALAFAVSAVPARATTMTIAAHTLPYWGFTLPGQTIYLEITVDSAFTATNLVTYQPWSPSRPGGWRKRVPCTVTLQTLGTGEKIYSLNIPTFDLESTIDAPIGTKEAQYSARFVNAQGTLLSTYADFDHFKLPNVFATGTTGTWSDIKSFNTGPQQVQYDLTYYSRQETLRLIAEAVAGASGVHMLNGLLGPNLDIVPDSNVTITPAGTTITVGLGTNATAAVTHAGTSSFTSNGVIYGGGAGAFGVTGAPPANSVLTGNGGSPSFSQAPVVNNSLTIGVGGSQTGTLVYRNSTNTNNVTVQAGVTSASYALTWPTAQGAANSTIQNDGSGNLSFTTSPTLGSGTFTGNVTVGGLTATRVVYAGVAGLLSGDADYTYDQATNRLSIGTTRSDFAINLGNATYLSAEVAATGSSKRLIGLNSSNQVAIAPDGSRVMLVSEVFGNVTPSATYTTGAPEYDALPSYVVPPYSFAFQQKGVWSTNGTGNQWAITGIGETSGTRQTVGVAGIGHATGTAATSTFGGNFIADVPTSGAALAGATALEVNPTNVGSGTNKQLFGITVQNVGGSAFGTVLGSFQSFIQMGISFGGAIDHNAAVRNGIVFDSSATNPILTAAEATAAGFTSSLINVTGPIDATFGLDFRTLTASLGAAAFKNNTSVAWQNSGNTATVPALMFTGADYLEVGVGLTTYGQVGTRILDGGAEAARFVSSGTTGVAGNVGLNQTSPAAHVHLTSVVKRTLTGSAFSINNGSPNLTATLSLFTTELAPGSTIEISAQAGTYYVVKSITNATQLVLTTNYTGGNTTTSTGKADYAALKVEGRGGDPWVDIDNQHTVVITGESVYNDERGMLQIRDRQDTTQRLIFGYDNALGGYITTLKAGTGQKNLVINGGGGNVGVGQTNPTAQLHVLGSGAKTADFIASKFDNSATSVAAFTKIALDMDGTGSWVGNATGLRIAGTGAFDATSSGNKSNYPLVTANGKTLHGPAFALATVPSAYLDVYSTPTENITVGADTLTTVSANAVVSGSGTSWATQGAADFLEAGTGVIFGTDTTPYEVLTVTNDTSLTLTTVYGGTGAGNIEGYTDAPLLRLRNALGNEKFKVTGAGTVVASGASFQTGSKTKALTEGAATSFARVDVPSGNYVAGYVVYTCVANDGVDYQSRSGLIPFSVVNKAGTETATVGTVTTATEVVAVSSGTLTLAITADTTPTNGINLQANATSSLVQTTLQIRYYVYVTSSTANVSPVTPL